MCKSLHDTIGFCRRLCGRIAGACLATVLAVAPATTAAAPPAERLRTDDPRAVLSAAEWDRVDEAVDRALHWLALQQQSDGSFPTLPNGQPGVTSLSVLAFLAHGHLPNEGPYGRVIERAVQYVIRQQKPSGLIAALGPPESYLHRNVLYENSSSVAYNHAISALALSETYGVQGSDDAASLAPVIEQALRVSLEMQRWSKREVDQGGWRYMKVHDDCDSDLSITGWELMFLRSSKNCGFDVPQQPIDDAVAYVRRCFDEQYGAFVYEIAPYDRRSRAMAGAGVLALAHAGFHNSREAQLSGRWILRHGFDRYNYAEPFSSGNNQKDRYHYGVFNCCQAMYQLGGEFWQGFFPGAARALVANQQVDGSWPIDSNMKDGIYGNAYSTSLALLALAAPNQLLPIFQR